eukprot:6291487-Pyramimonas_sp.AAC.1
MSRCIADAEPLLCTLNIQQDEAGWVALWLSEADGKQMLDGELKLNSLSHPLVSVLCKLPVRIYTHEHCKRTPKVAGGSSVSF